MSDTQFGPGSFGCHEALHMALFLTNAVYEELVCHPAVEANPEWLELAKAAERNMMALYQAIGGKHIPDESSKAASHAD